MPGWSAEAPAGHCALSSRQGCFPRLPVTVLQSRRLWGRASPTYVVILRGVAGGRPEEVLGELGLRQPIDFAALGAACASPLPHPQVLA